MPLGRTCAEALLAAGNELPGQRNLGYQHQRLLTASKRSGDRLEIDFGLARAGDAVEQAYREAAAGIGEERARGLGLLWRELRALTRNIERQGVPVGQRLGHERAGFDEPVDHAGAPAGGLGEARLDPDEPIADCF